MEQFDMRQEFVRDPQRFNRFSGSACGLFLDYSKNLIRTDTMQALFAFADACTVHKQFARQVRGEVVNTTEERPATHTALRATQEDLKHATDEARTVWRQEQETRARMFELRQQLTTGQLRGFSGKPLNTVVNVGIGGSHLGPYLVCNALPAAVDAPNVLFLASPSECGSLLKRIDPATTLFIFSSKSFSTEETLANARAIRALYQESGARDRWMSHLAAITANRTKAVAFGVPVERIFDMASSVGGRFSLWSAIGLPIIMHLGQKKFEDLQRGGRAMDQHSLHNAQNLPLILALLSYWYGMYWGASTHCVNVYEPTLGLLPVFLQQLMMESCGKTTNSEGERLDLGGPILWGGEGPNVQHSYMQLCHQGHQLIPLDIILGRQPMHADEPGALEHHHILAANALAQAQALLIGRDAKAQNKAANKVGLAAPLANHLAMPGNRPSNCLIYERLDAFTLGALISLYEHRTVFFGYLLDINPFDQWGVELGKQLSDKLKPVLTKETIPEHWDSSTAGLVAYIKKDSS